MTFSGRHTIGTGAWLLYSKAFKEWVSADKQTLFCPGVPGAGKTTITSIVIDHVWNKFESDANVGIAYIYCNFKRGFEQRLVNLLSSLLRQLLHTRRSISDNVRNLYESYRTKQIRPSIDEIRKALHDVADQFTSLFILIDALDECSAADGSRVEFLSEVFNLQGQNWS